MNQTYTIKNFRVFDEQGATFEMAPLTILTGCNSSGKSSMTKSLMLLSPLMSQYKKDIQTGAFGGFSGTGFSSYDLDFTRGKHKLGSLEKVVNWDSKEKTFTVSYSIFSHALGEMMDVILTFGKPYEDKNSQTLHAQLQKVEIRHEERVFYQYKCGNPVAKSAKHKALDSFEQADSAHVNIADWKTELIRGLQTLEMGFTISRMYEDRRIDDAGYGYDVHFHYGAIESLKGFYSDDTINLLVYIYNVLKERTPHHVKKLCEKFDFKNLKPVDSTGVGIDWEGSENKFEFPYLHVYSLLKLMDDLNAVSKEDIIKYAEDHFINAESVAKMWYNTDEYKKWIHEIFSSFVESDFEKFSDFYSYYENVELKNEFVYFGTRGGHTRVLSEGNNEFLFGGTASEVEGGCRFSFMKKEWAEMSDSDKFTCIFWCLQGFAGYEDLSAVGGPSPSLRLLDILREYATIACAELFTSCDFLTETDFIEIDRSNAQRIYSFAAQGTDFNNTLDRYFNMSETAYYDYDTDHLNGKTYTKGSFSQKWIKELIGFEDFKLEQAPEGVGYYVYLIKKLPSGEERKISLADMGYGVTPLLSMLLRIEIMLGAYMDKPERATVYIEEPESNLHPKIQSKLAEIFADAVANYPINIVLETHSEYLIRKLQVLVAEDKVQPGKIALHYLYSPDKELRSEEEKDMPQVKHIEIQSDGSLSDSFGSGFFDEASKHFQNLMNL